MKSRNHPAPIKTRGGEQLHQWRFDLPLYIKPHGTVSEPASLRFTRNAYFALPPDMARLLRTLVGGAPTGAFLSDPTKDDSGQFEQIQQIPLCFLVLGHALGSFEFNRMLEQSPPGSRLYFTGFGSSKAPEFREDSQTNMRKMAKGRMIRLSDDQDSLDNMSTLDNMMKSLWTYIYDIASRSEPKVLLRGIDRHTLIAYLFYPTRFGILLRNPSKIDDKKTNIEYKTATITYIEDRVIVEIVLAIAKAKGFIHLWEISHGRAGTYYRMLCDVMKNERPPSIANYLKDIGMVRRDASSEAYWHKDMAAPRVPSRAGAPTESIKERLTLDPGRFRHGSCQKLVAVCRRFLSHNRKNRLTKTGSDLVRSTLYSMFSGDEIEIIPAHHADFAFNKMGNPPALPG